MPLNQIGLAGALSMAPIVEAQQEPWRAFHFSDDFDHFDTTATTGKWIATTATGTVAKADAHGGQIVITGTTTDDQGAQVQSASEIVKIEAGKKVYAEARIKISDVDKAQFGFGLATKDTTMFGSGAISTSTVTEFIGFVMTASSQGSNGGYLQFQCHNAAGSFTQTSATAMPLTDATWHRCGFIVDYSAKTVTIYLDDACIEVIRLTDTQLTYLPTSEVCVGMAAYSESGGGTPPAITCHFDRVDVVGDR